MHARIRLTTTLLLSFFFCLFLGGTLLCLLYVTQSGDNEKLYLPGTAVVLAESFKLISSLLLIAFQEGGIVGMVKVRDVLSWRFCLAQFDSRKVLGLF